MRRTEPIPNLRLTIAIRTVRVELAARVALGDVDLRQVADAGDLDVVRGLDEVRARDRAVGDEARAVAGLDAPRDLDALRVSDDGVGAGARRRENAEVVERGDCFAVISGAQRGARKLEVLGQTRATMGRWRAHAP